MITIPDIEEESIHFDNNDELPGRSHNELLSVIIRLVDDKSKLQAELDKLSTDNTKLTSNMKQLESKISLLIHQHHLQSHNSSSPYQLVKYYHINRVHEFTSAATLILYNRLQLNVLKRGVNLYLGSCPLKLYEWFFSLQPNHNTKIIYRYERYWGLLLSDTCRFLSTINSVNMNYYFRSQDYLSA